LTETEYPSSLVGLANSSANLPTTCIGNYTTSFMLQEMAFKGLFRTLNENHGIIDGTIIFWWNNPSTNEWYYNRYSNVWSCSWTSRGKSAECIIGKVFGGKCSSHRNHPK
jgi:hypothetical protein